MSHADFSIVTPTLQAERFIAQCVRSGADQGVSVEHLVQDGASTDRTAQIARDLGASVEVAPDESMYDALNHALERSQGRILTQLNADEQLLPGALRRVEEALADADGTTVVSGDVVIVDASLQPIAYRRVTPQRRLHATYSPSATVLTAGTFYPRQLLDDGVLRFGTTYERLGDLELFKRLTDHRVRWITISEPLAVFVQHDSNLALTPGTALEGDRFLGTGPRRRLLGAVGRVSYWLEKALHGGYRRRDVELDVYDRGSDHRRRIRAEGLTWRWNPLRS